MNVEQKIQNCVNKSGNDLFTYWENNDCITPMYLFLNTTDNEFVYSRQNNEQIQQYMNTLFKNYELTNTITNDKSSSQYNPFQETLIELCSNPSLPGVCQSFLSEFCSQYTRSDVIGNSTLTNFCGCYVPPDPTYAKYILGNIQCVRGLPGCEYGCEKIDSPETENEENRVYPFDVKKNIQNCVSQPQCDPLCHRNLTSQKANINNGKIITCSQNICIIDNTTIQSYDNNLQGSINFNSVCTGCGGTSKGKSCYCLISGTDLQDTSEQVNLSYNYNYFCGPESLCFENGEPTSCEKVTSSKISKKPSPKPNYGLIIIFGIFLFILFVFLIKILFF